MRPKIIFLPLLLLLLLTGLNACVTYPHLTGPRTAASPAPPADTPAPALAPDVKPGGKVPTGPGRAATVRQRLRPLLKNGDHLAVVVIINQEVLQGLQEQAVAEEFLAALDGLLARSEQLLRSGEFAQAGDLLQATLQHYPRTGALAAQVEQSPETLLAKRNMCADKLMEAGLSAYRAEQFDLALDLWRQLLGFAPEHAAARKAVQTTELQLAQLRALTVQ